jgi:membrane-associated protein
LATLLNLILEFWSIITHLDTHLAGWATTMGPWLYLLLFIVVFCETGLVVTPFLPGDSLLFAVGAICALEDANLNVWIMTPLLLVAAILGDATNYSIGRAIGPRVFQSEGSFLLNRKHLDRTQEFYERYGGKTIVIARFVPIVRTFAPFVAGVGRMEYSRFAMFNVVGAVAWVGLFIPAGYMPAVIEIWRERRRALSRAA